MSDIEAICVAVEALAKTAVWSSNPSGFKVVSRRVVLFSDAALQPALYQAEHEEQTDQVSNMPYKTTVDINWIVYQNVAQDLTAVGATENNLILAALKKVLEPQTWDPGYPDERNTLNGLCYHCYISGNIFKDPGDIDGQGMMVIPIKVLVP